jgi:hypothetical protein
MDKKNKLWLAVSLLFSLLGVALILHYTRMFPGVGGDSVQYVMGAENILDGEGYARFTGEGETRPITGFPPLYSVVLAGLGLVGVDLFEGAQILNALLFGGSIFISGVLIWGYTRSLWAMVIGNALILTSLSLVKIHGMVMTEPLFIFLMLLTIFTLTKYISAHRLSYLILSSIMISLATITRYAGLGLLGAGGLSILLLSRTNWKRRLVDCAVLSGFTFVPLYFWLRRNTSAGGTAVNRELIFHPMDLKLARVFLAEIASWFAPRILGLSRPLRNVIVLIMALPWPTLFYLQELRQFFKGKGSSRKAFWSLPWILAFYIFSYFVILIINSTLLDAGTSMGAPIRYLAPVFVAVVIIFAIAVQQLIERWGVGNIPKLLALSISVTLIVLYTLQVLDLVSNPISVGGYFEYKYKRADAVREFEALESDIPIISNNPEMVYIMSNRTAYMWPIEFDHYRLEEREDYLDQIEATQEKLSRGGVLVVYGWPEGADTLVFDLLEAERFAHFIDISFFGYPDHLQKGS